MPPKKLKSKPLVLYVSDPEKKIFKRHAKKGHTSMSKYIKHAALMYINTVGAVQPVNVQDTDTALVDSLRKEIVELKTEIVELKTVPTIQGTPDRMAEQIFNHLKSVTGWTTDQELHDIFNITTQEEHDDFLIGMHQLQFHHADELKYSARWGWKVIS